MTPAGTRDIRTFFGACVEFMRVGAFVVAKPETRGTTAEGSCGGGAVSKVEVMDVGSESKA